MVEARALVAYFGPVPSGGAASRYLHGLARLLRQHWTIDLVAPRRSGQRYTERNGPGRMYRVPLGDGPVTAAEGRYLRALQRQFRAESYQAAIVADPLTAMALHHAGQDDLRIIYVLREIRAEVCLDYLGRLREALDLASHVVVPDQFVLSRMMELGIPQERLVILDLVPETRGFYGDPAALNPKRLILPAVHRSDGLLDEIEQVPALPGVEEILLIGDRTHQAEMIEISDEWQGVTPLRFRTVGSPRGLALQLRKGGIALLSESLEAYGALSLPHDALPACLCAGLPVLQMARRLPVPDRYAGALRSLESIADLVSVLEEGQRLKDLWPALAYRSICWRQTLSRPNGIVAQWLDLMGQADDGTSMTFEKTVEETDGSNSHTLTDWAETDSMAIMPTGDGETNTSRLAEETVD
ncbi:MAG: hypothetical protein CMH50_07710 [Myxococcales bacterium]|nr:hypothetical protein [Myxococcales bacterium]